MWLDHIHSMAQQTPPQRRPRFCVNCGEMVEATGRFCAECGEPVRPPPKLGSQRVRQALGAAKAFESSRRTRTPPDGDGDDDYSSPRDRAAGGVSGEHTVRGSADVVKLHEKVRTLERVARSFPGLVAEPRLVLDADDDGMGSLRIRGDAGDGRISAESERLRGHSHMGGSSNAIRVLSGSANDVNTRSYHSLRSSKVDVTPSPARSHGNVVEVMTPSGPRLMLELDGNSEVRTPETTIENFGRGRGGRRYSSDSSSTGTDGDSVYTYTKGSSSCCSELRWLGCMLCFLVFLVGSIVCILVFWNDIAHFLKIESGGGDSLDLTDDGSLGAGQGGGGTDGSTGGSTGGGASSGGGVSTGGTVDIFLAQWAGAGHCAGFDRSMVLLFCPSGQVAGTELASSPDLVRTAFVCGNYTFIPGDASFEESDGSCQRYGCLDHVRAEVTYVIDSPAEIRGSRIEGVNVLYRETGSTNQLRARCDSADDSDFFLERDESQASPPDNALCATCDAILAAR